MARHVHDPEPRAADHGESAHDHDDAHEHEHDDEHEHEGHSHAGKDPHIWLSPPLLKTQAETVAEELSELDPANAEAYKRNLAELHRRLDEVDEEVGQQLEPFRGRAFFVFHPAWGYFADRYGLRQVAVELEGKEPTDHELTLLLNEARQEDAKVVFVQPEISSRFADAVADAVGGRVETLDPLAEDVPAGLLRAARAISESYGEQ
jgi:zinc transport system substrate-binding protein